MKTIACLALREFTVFVEGYGQIVGAPESSLPEAQKPAVPEHAVGRLVADGLVKAPKGWKAAEPEPEPEPAQEPAPESGDQAPA